MTIPKVFEDVFASAVDVGGGLPHDVNVLRGVGNFLPLERDVDEVPHGDEKWIPCVIQQSTSLIESYPNASAGAFSFPDSR